MLERHPVDNPVILRDFMACPEEYKKWGFPGHEGLDYQSSTGEPVYPCSPGSIYRVEKFANRHPYGIHVRISHQLSCSSSPPQLPLGGQGGRGGQGGGVGAEGQAGSSSLTLKTIYAHLSQVDVVFGQTVDIHHPIGEAGSTGNSSCPHLHLTVKAEGIPLSGYAPGFASSLHIVNPWNYLPLLSPPPLVGGQGGSGAAGAQSGGAVADAEVSHALSAYFSDLAGDSSPLLSARVIVPSLNVRSQPSITAPIVSTLANDQPFHIYGIFAHECWALTSAGWVALFYDSQPLASISSPSPLSPPPFMGEGREGVGG